MGGGEGYTFGLLGPVFAAADGIDLRLGGLKQRSVLAQLLLHLNRAVSADALVDGLWGDAPPARAGATLQVHVANLRRALEAGAPSPIVTEPHGYALRAAPEAFDLERFSAATRHGRSALASGEAEDAAAHLRAALSEWRGPALADVVSEPFAGLPAARLDEERMAALELRIEADLACGAHAELVGELSELTGEHPVRERLRAQLVVALYRCGRQADALAAIAHARSFLRDNLGLDPGSELVALERDVLLQDPRLDWRPRAVRPKPPGSTTAAVGEPGELIVALAGREHVLTKRSTIGRDDGSDIVVDDLRASRRHATVRPTSMGFVVRDEHSTNGTYVNGELVDQARLSPGDVVRIGDTELRVVRVTAPRVEA